MAGGSEHSSFWSSSVLSKINYRILLAWLALVMVGYYLTLPSLSQNGSENSPYSYSTQSALISDRAKEMMPQAIVFIAMGELSREPLVHDAVSAVRLVGHWHDKIVILTDRPACFSEYTEKQSNTLAIAVESKANIIEIKKMKAEIFSYLPQDIDRVLYMDVDILITRNVGFFLHDLTHLLYMHQHRQRASTVRGAAPVVIDRTRRLGAPATTAVSLNATVHTTAVETTAKEKEKESDYQFDFAAFLDAKGHYVGMCSGCEKWHTGVMYLRRQYGARCLQAWSQILSSGKFTTDQESLDYAENTGACTHSLAIPSRHLLFAKDYIGMLLTSGQTFIHLTAANRAETQDAFYTDYIIPRIRNSLHPPLKPYNANAPKKTC